MLDRAALLRLGKLVADDIAAGQPGPNCWAASEVLEAHPDAVLDLIDMLVAEGRKKRPNESLASAYAYMIGQILDPLRMAQENGYAEAGQLLDAVRRTLLDLGTSGQVEPPLLLLILMQFSDAKLDPGPELRQLMASLMEQAGAKGGAGEGDEDFGSFIEDLVGAADGDPFALHAQIMEMAEALPEDHRAAMGIALLQSSEAAAREAAVGWLLDAAGEVRHAMATALGHAARHGAVSGTMLRRMIALRNLLPEPDRPALDQAIQACRRNSVECAPWPQPRIREVIVSGVDGAGTQSLFVLAGEERRHAIGCLLVKFGIGVRDAWARHGLARADADSFLEQVEGGIDVIRVGLDYVRIATAHFLAVNAASGTMPPFALLDFAETAGLHALQPEPMPLDRVLGLLGADPEPDLLQPRTVAELLESSRDLPDEFDFLDSWFEDGAEVEQLLAGKRRSRAKQEALVRDTLLPKHAEKWAERLAWTALALRHSEDEEPWQEFFVSAREVLAGRPMAEIPLMVHVAEVTVDAYLASRSGPRIF